jgi:hypothetical protein
MNSESGRGDWIRTSDPLRPRQVRYQAALRPDSKIPNFTTVPAAPPVRVRRLLAKNCRRTVSKPNSLSQNPRLIIPPCPRAPPLVGRTIELPQRLALHLQLHLRVLLEHLRVALAEERNVAPSLDEASAATPF